MSQDLRVFTCISMGGLFSSVRPSKSLLIPSNFFFAYSFNATFARNQRNARTAIIRVEIDLAICLPRASFLL